jgi:hypothetical protein
MPCDNSVWPFRRPVNAAMTQSRPILGVTARAMPAKPAPVRSGLTSRHDIKERLRQVRLRPTRQRMALAGILFAKGDRHVTPPKCFMRKQHSHKSPCRWRQSITRCTSSPMLAFYVRSRSTRPEPILTRTIPLTITFTSRTRTSSWTFLRPMCFSAPCRPHRRVMRSSVSMLSCGCGESRNAEAMARIPPYLGALALLVRQANF